MNIFTIGSWFNRLTRIVIVHINIEQGEKKKKIVLTWNRLMSITFFFSLIGKLRVARAHARVVDPRLQPSSLLLEGGWCQLR